MERLNIAIVGSGAIAQEHLAAYRELGDLAHVVMIVSSDPDRGRALATQFPGARTTTNIDEALDDGGIDAIDICGHTLDHASRAARALRSGKHVLIEKPPALTLDEFDRIAAATTADGPIAMVGQTVRFQPAMTSIIDRVDAGEIGTVSLVHISWYVAHVWPRAWRGWQLDNVRSGGHLIHNGMHSIDLALRLLDEQPVSVFTRGWSTYSPDLPTPDSFHLLLRCTGGGLAVLETSYGLRPPAQPVRRIVVSGAHGTLSHSTTTEAELFNPVLAGTPPSVVGAMVHEIRAWLTAIATGGPSPIPLHASRTALATAIAAQASLDQGVPIAVAHAGAHPDV